MHSRARKAGFLGRRRPGLPSRQVSLPPSRGVSTAAIGAPTPTAPGCLRTDTKARGCAGPGMRRRHTCAEGSGCPAPRSLPAGHTTRAGSQRPRPPGEPPPSRRSAPYLEERTDLILLQVGLDPGLLVRRHEALRRWELELLFPGGGCSRLLPRRRRAATEGAGDGAAKGRQPPEVPGTERTRGAGAGSRLPGGGRLRPLRERRAGAAWSTALCRRERAAKAAPSLLCSALCVCVCACTRLTAPWLREQPRLRATALATAPRPELPAGGSCQCGRWRPGSALKRRERGKGRRAGGRRGRLCSLALRQSVLLVSPEAKSWRFGGEPLRLPGCPEGKFHGRSVQRCLRSRSRSW